MRAATSLLKAYRTHGHLAANLDPLGSTPRGDPGIEPENLNLTPEVMAQIPASILRIGVPGETLLEALPPMREAYCGTIAYQFEHLASHEQRTWLREMIETGAHRQPLEDEEKRRLLHRLIDVFEFERFLQKTYLGQKVFSIEGLDAVVPMLDETFAMADSEGAKEVVIGMAHRGRLSVLAHNVNRPFESIFAEFEGSKQIDAVKAVAAIPHGGTGDVKYHYGHAGMYKLPDGREFQVRLYPNPSHLEFVNPVVEGATRGQHSQGRRGSEKQERARTPRCRSSCTATPRSRARGWSRDAQPARPRGATARAEPSTSSKTTRWASPPIRRKTVRRRTRRTWPRASTSRSSTSTPTAWRPGSLRYASRWPTGRWGRDIVIDVVGLPPLRPATRPTSPHTPSR